MGAGLEKLGETVVIRPYDPADRAACLAVCESDVPRFIAPPEVDGFAQFLDRLPDLPVRYVVLEHRELGVVACGGLSVKEDTGVATLCWGLVRADLHRRGLGARMLEARLDWADADPRVRSVALDTSQHTRAFFERYGFEAHEVTPDHYGPGLHRVDMVRMR